VGQFFITAMSAEVWF